MITDTPPRMLTLDEVCKSLTITKTTAYRLLREGSFPIPHTRVGDRFRFSPTLVERFVRGEEL